MDTLNCIAGILGVPAAFLTFLGTVPRGGHEYRKLVKATKAAILAAIKAHVELQEPVHSK